VNPTASGRIQGTPAGHELPVLLVAQANRFAQGNAMAANRKAAEDRPRDQEHRVAQRARRRFSSIIGPGCECIEIAKRARLPRP